MNYFCPKESDWKLFRKLVPVWQENYMGRLLAEYQKIINENNNPSTRFWKLNDRMMNDKKSPGVSFFCNEDGYKDMYNFDIAEDSIKIKNRLKTTLFKKTNYNGTLEIGNDIKLKRLGIQTVATECNIDSVYAETISIKNVNGSYTLNNVLGTNIRIDNVNGKISANNLLSKEDIFLSTVSGKMEIENIESKGIYLNTISGNYEITNISADEVKLSTISGNIKIETARVKDKNINSSKISGEIIINKYL